MEPNVSKVARHTCTPIVPLKHMYMYKPSEKNCGAGYPIQIGTAICMWSQMIAEGNNANLIEKFMENIAPRKWQ